MKRKKLAMKQTTPFPTCLISIFLCIVFLTSLFWPEKYYFEDFTRQLSDIQHSMRRDFSKSIKTTPKWHQFAPQSFKKKGFKIGLLLNVGEGKTNKKIHDELPQGADIKKVKFQPVGEDIKWKDLYPGSIDEEHPELQKCPEIPMPRFSDYQDLNAVVTAAPCPGEATREGFNDVFRLQVNLVVANLLVRSNNINNEDLYAVFLGSCGPMFEIFRCEDLLWHDNNTWIYKPDLRRLKDKVEMPVGSCQLARPVADQADAGQERREKATTKTISRRRPREAYVTVLHSSEDYVCGAIVLGQSILRSQTNRDLILLADSSISPESLTGLRAAGWKIKPIQRIKSPHAEKFSYNEYNYSKLRIWQLTEYDKILFIDSDLLVLKNLDDLFSYSPLSAALNSRHIFNSGVILIEPSVCTFETLMEKTLTTASYNGGDQGFLNEIFRWWHRWPRKVNFLKEFSAEEYGPDHRLPETVRAIHYLGVKPWLCYRDYDCSWDRYPLQIFASDSAHAMWWKVFDSMPERLKPYCDLSPETEEGIVLNRLLAKEFNHSNGHWKITEINDPRRRRHDI